MFRLDPGTGQAQAVTLAWSALSLFALRSSLEGATPFALPAPAPAGLEEEAGVLAAGAPPGSGLDGLHERSTPGGFGSAQASRPSSSPFGRDGLGAELSLLARLASTHPGEGLS